LQKIINILAFIFLTAGCAVIKKDINKMVARNETAGNLSFEEKVRLHNITNNGFFITRANISIDKEGVIINTIANIRYNAPQKYLISIRSFGGIEAARIMITEDTLLINDRINKRLLYGNPDYIRRNYGIDPVIIPVIFGDFYSRKNHSVNPDDCINGEKKRTEVISKFKYIYTFDCSREKLINTVIESDREKSVYILNYGEFARSGEIIYPKNIRLERIDDNIKINIEIKEIEYPWNENFEFIPGSKYEKIKLL
jgi:hypothetical protein